MLNYKNSKVTVITIVKDMEDKIEKTIKTVINQTYSNIEYIVIDGCSKDSTFEKINKYKNRITKIIQLEPKGIWNAMNHGIELVTGDWIIFTNGGDGLCSKDALTNISKYLQDKSIDIIYGNTRFDFYFGYSKISNANKIKYISNGMIAHHQSILARTNLMKKYPFDVKNIIADYDFILKCYYKKYKFKQTSQIIGIREDGGFMSERPIQAVIKSWQTRKKYKKSFLLDFYQIKKLIQVIMVTYLMKIIPKSIQIKLILFIRGDKMFKTPKEMF